MKSYLMVSLLLIFLACDGIDEARETEKIEFEVTVVGPESCNYVLIEFREEDLEAVQQITGKEGTKYHALNLKKILLHPGQKLVIEIRNLNEDEWFDCPTFSPTYSAVVILTLRITL